MSGYTPLFDSLTRGTLCGRWPDIGLWPIVLSLADKNGEVDVTPLYIAGITGLPEPEVVACMKRFCEPDPYSRSTTNEGRRLELLDDHRDWGWLIVNHTKYREKARKIAHDQRRQESGENAERMRARREKTTRRDPTRPDATPDNPLSNANANTNKNTTGGKAAPADEFDERFKELQAVYPKRSGDQRWQTAKKHIRARLREGHTWQEILSGALRYAEWVHATGKERTETVKQAATFVGVDKAFMEEFEAPSPTKPTDPAGIAAARKQAEYDKRWGIPRPDLQ